jgi:GT2 family glycosyltransferase
MSETETPTVATVVPNWNGLADTRECLQSLRAAPYSNNRIVVGGSSSRDDEAPVAQAEFVNIILVVSASARSLCLAEDD